MENWFERKGERERKKAHSRSDIDLVFHLFMHLLVNSCMCSNPWIEPTILAYQDYALTNWATWPGHILIIIINKYSSIINIVFLN